MKKYLSSSGNSWQIYLNKPIAQLMGVTPDEYTVLLNIENKILYVKKVNPSEMDKYKDYLCKKLIKRKSGYALNLDIPILELLEINPEETMITYEINGKILIIKKAE